MFAGILLIMLGVLVLLSQLDILPGNWWDYFWPLCIVAVGVSMIFRHKKEPTL